jgi:PAS domain S-box-containing protein
MASNSSDDDDNQAGSPIASFLGMDRSSFLNPDRSVFLQNYSSAPLDPWSVDADPSMGMSSVSSSSSLTSSSMQLPNQFAYSSKSSTGGSTLPLIHGQATSSASLQSNQQQLPVQLQQIRAGSGPLTSAQQVIHPSVLQHTIPSQRVFAQPTMPAGLPGMLDQLQMQQQQLQIQQQQQQQIQMQQQHLPYFKVPQHQQQQQQSLNALAAATADLQATVGSGRSSARGRRGGAASGSGSGGGGGDISSSLNLNHALTSSTSSSSAALLTSASASASSSSSASDRKGSGKQAVEEHEEEEEDEDDQDDDQQEETGSSKKKMRSSSTSGGASSKVAQSRERNKIHARKSRLRKKFLLDNLKANLGGVEEENENLRMMVVKLTGKTYEELMTDSAAGRPLVSIAPPLSAAGVLAVGSQSVVPSPRIASVGALPLVGAGLVRPIDTFADLQMRQPAVQQIPQVLSSLPFTQAVPSSVGTISPTSAPLSSSSTSASAGVSSGSGPAQTVPSSVITAHDFELVKALALAQHNFVISDPALPDNPIVFASTGFYALTGYSPDEVIGRNCRFLQGAATDPRAIAAIRKGVVEGKDTAVCLINYKKDGTSFWNRFFIAALKSVDGKIVNYVGVQCQVSDALARVLVDMQSRRKPGETDLTAEGEASNVSVTSV